MISVEKYKNQKILILGYGIVGKATSKSLLKGFADVFIWDDVLEKRNEAKRNGLKILDINIENPLKNISAIIVSPGISHLYPKPHFLIKIALNESIEIDNDISLFFQSFNNHLSFKKSSKVICITGTNGKSSTCHLLNHILKKFNYDTEIGGNFGKAALSLLPQKSGSIKILEVSSYQLEIAKKIKSDISALVNFSSDHFDRHSGRGGYFSSKLNLFLKNNSKNSVINVNNNEGMFLENKVSNEKKKKNRVITFSTNKSLKGRSWSVFLEKEFLYEFKNGKEIIKFDLKKIETFNNTYDYENLFVAYSICRLMKLPPETIIESLKGFKGLKHRNQFLGEVNGVSFVNDSKATNFSSAVKSIKSNKNIRLILGGKSKSESISEYLKDFGNVKSIYLIGSSSKEFSKFLEKFCFKVCNNLDIATKTAFEEAIEGDSVLLAPACSSFDQFKSFEERGEMFIRIFHNIKKSF